MSTDTSPLPPFAAIVVAAGSGTRAGQSVPKQFAPYRGKALVAHSVAALVEAGADPLVVAIPRGMEVMAAQTLEDFPQIRFVTGGETRQESVYRALEEMAEFDVGAVLIHDAARPDLPRDVIGRLLDALATHHGAIPVLEVVDTLVEANDDRMGGTAQRDRVRRVQTPQAFHFSAVLNAHRGWPGPATATDDAQVVRESGGDVALVEGDERLRKITFAEDFDLAEEPSAAENSPFPHPQSVARTPARVAAPRMGIGYDVHRLIEGSGLVLCGVKIDHTHRLSGHSDADVGIHALVDAILGALAAGDIGDHFPPTDPQWADASSDRFLTHAVRLVREAGYTIGNVDVTLICEAPRIGPHREAMRARLAAILGVDIVAVSVKATTTEHLGFTGRREGIAAQAIASLIAA